MNVRPGFDSFTWKLVRPFAGRVATPTDVEAAKAVFALADTEDGRTMDLDLPSPAVWTNEEDEDFAALVIQAEAHDTGDGVTMEVLGLLLPDGETAVALMEDVEFVEDSDPVWISLIEADLEDMDGDEDE